MRIGEFSKQTGLAAHTIRFYESKGLLPKPKRGVNGYRTYSEESVQILSRIQTAQRLGFSLEDIHSLVGDKANADGLDHEKLLGHLDARLLEVDLLLKQLTQQKVEIKEFKKRLEINWEQGTCMQADELTKLNKDVNDQH